MNTRSTVGATPPWLPVASVVFHMTVMGRETVWHWKTGGHRGRPYENNTHNKHGGKP